MCVFYGSLQDNLPPIYIGIYELQSTLVYQMRQNYYSNNKLAANVVWISWEKPPDFLDVNTASLQPE
jgi:hypothetical protein